MHYENQALLMGWLGLVLAGVSGLLCLARLWYFIKGPGDYYGPKPTPEQTRETSQFIVNHLMNYPSDELAKQYPEEAKAAAAHRAYAQINDLYEAGQISAEFYDAGVELIAGQINIKEDIKP